MIQPPFFIFHPKSFPLCHPHQPLSQHVHSKHQFDASPLPTSPCRPHHCLWIYAHPVHPRPTLAHFMPQSDVPNLADAYMQTSPSSPKAKYLWEAFNRAKEYASEARDRTPPPLPMEAESTSKSRRREVLRSCGLNARLVRNTEAST